MASGRNECMIAQNASPSDQLERKSLMFTFCGEGGRLAMGNIFT